jgi:upstream activation factor subunit UAF30
MEAGPLTSYRVAPSIAAAKRKKSEANAEGKKQRTGGGFTKPQPLSTALADFLGVDEMPRSQVVKTMWAYIKDNALQDPENKKNIICDDRLQQVLGVSKFVGFSMMKYLNKHFLPING